MKAIFIDRDGVINKQVFDENRKVYRSPHSISEIEILPNVISSLKKVYNMGYSLFIVTNQPDAVKGWTNIESLEEIRKYIFGYLMENDIGIRDDYYCFHHPDFCPCECRKPSPLFLLQASKSYNIDLSRSWMIGDRETDVICGKNAGTKTIFIGKEKSLLSDFTADDLKEATEIIKFCDEIRRK